MSVPKNNVHFDGIVYNLRRYTTSINNINFMCVINFVKVWFIIVHVFTFEYNLPFVLIDIKF